jgi:hypothetical protein
MAVRDGDHRFRAIVDSGQHVRKPQGIGFVLGGAPPGGGAHPVEIGASRKALAGAVQHDGAHLDHLAQPGEGFGQCGDQIGVEGVVPLRPVEGQAGGAEIVDGLVKHGPLTS